MNNENDSIGFLEVVVKTAGGALPLENARVSIYEYLPQGEVGDNGRLLFSLLTDESGKTPRVALPAKDKSLSLTFGNKSPYTVYNIGVSKDGYYNNSYLKVPIFQGVSSIQPVELSPLYEYAQADDDFPDWGRRFVETPSTNL